MTPRKTNRAQRAQKAGETMIERLKNLDTDRIDLDEAVELSAFARSLRAEYETLAMEVPEWLDNNARALRREINARQADAVEKRLREAKMRREALTPAEEKRKKLDDEIAKLEAQLAAK